MDLIPGSGRSLGGGHGNPLQYSSWRIPMDRGTWWAIVYWVTQSQTQLKRLSMHTYTNELLLTDLNVRHFPRYFISFNPHNSLKTVLTNPLYK